MGIMHILGQISIGNNMISSDIWHKYYEWYFKIVIVISRAVRRVKFETIWKYHEWYLCEISRTNHAIICLYYYPQKVVIFTCRYFKLSWNTTALSQSNCKNFSCSSIRLEIPLASTINSKYILPFHLASERNKSMICLTAI